MTRPLQYRDVQYPSQNVLFPREIPALHNGSGANFRPIQGNVLVASGIVLSQKEEYTRGVQILLSHTRCEGVYFRYGQKEAGKSNDSSCLQAASVVELLCCGRH